jgi:hypothetical protein
MKQLSTLLQWFYRFPVSFPVPALLALHVLMVTAVYSVCYALGIFTHLPEEGKLIIWDTLWYEKIMREGYSYSETAISNAAFFPLFPYLWRWSGLTDLGISAVNALIFLSGFGFLMRQFRLDGRLALLLLSSPLIIYMGLPYTEACFYFGCALLLAGLHRDKLWLVVIGVLISCLSRSASTLFVPAFLLTALLSFTPGSRSWKKPLLLLVTGFAFIALAVGTVMVMQYQQTGEALGFIKSQKHWSHVLQLPKHYLFTTGGINVLWLDGFALAIGLVSALAGVYLFRNRVLGWQKKTELIRLSPAVVFSMGYCISVSLFILLFQGSNLANIARYTFATPFFAVLLWQAHRMLPLSRSFYLWLTVGLFAFWALFGAFGGIQGFSIGQSLWYFGLLTVYVIVHLAYPQSKWGREAWGALYVFNLVIQFYLLNSFLQYYWIE